MLHTLPVTLGLSVLLLCRPAVVRAAQGPSPGAGKTPVVVMLGTGTPRPTPDAWGPATAVVVGSRVFLVDAGVGVERRLAAAGLPTNGLSAVFITHLHSDHVLGLSDVIFTSWVLGRTRPFPVYGPHGLSRMIDHLYKAFSEDIRIRTEGLEHESREGYRVDVREIGPSVVYDSAGVRVTAFQVDHGEWREAYGYRFDVPGRSIVFSGDTRPSEELVRMATGIDILFHEVQPSDSTLHPGQRSAAEWATYVRAYHTTALQLGELAARARPKLLVVYHNGRRVTDDRILANIRRSFSGPVTIAADLQRF